MKTYKQLLCNLLTSGSLLFSITLGIGTALSQEPNSIDILTQFYATGWMGDGELGTTYVNLTEASEDTPHSEPYCVKIEYIKFGNDGWAGIYWQNEPDNWGEEPGENLSKHGFQAIVFWARGAKGGEIVEFKAGGINTPGKKYKDSFKVGLGKIALQKEWKRYVIDLKGEDLSSVIGAFCWVANRPSNPKGLTFYLDDIRFVSSLADITPKVEKK